MDNPFEQDPYVDPYLEKGIDNKPVLKNKMGIKDAITLEKYENLTSGVTIYLLKENPLPTKSKADYKAHHKAIFGELYDWAGQTCSIERRKNEPILGNLTSVDYADPDKIEDKLDVEFQKLEKSNYLKNMDEYSFIDKLAKSTVEIWKIHAFRDGNTRTTFTFMNNLANDAGYKLNMEPIDKTKARDALVIAAKLNDYTEIKDIFYKGREFHLKENIQKMGKKKIQSELDVLTKIVRTKNIDEIEKRYQQKDSKLSKLKKEKEQLEDKFLQTLSMKKKTYFFQKKLNQKLEQDLLKLSKENGEVGKTIEIIEEQLTEIKDQKRHDNNYYITNKISLMRKELKKINSLAPKKEQKKGRSR